MSTPDHMTGNAGKLISIKREYVSHPALCHQSNAPLGLGSSLGRTTGALHSRLLRDRVQHHLHWRAHIVHTVSASYCGKEPTLTAFSAWIFSALDSAVRGTVQLLLDMGLVDEAKQITEEWMGRWIKI